MYLASLYLYMRPNLTPFISLEKTFEQAVFQFIFKIIQFILFFFTLASLTLTKSTLHSTS